MTKRRIIRIAAVAATAPLFALFFAPQANAAELGPLAEYVDETVADTGETVVTVVDALL